MPKYPIYFFDTEVCIMCGKRSVKCFDRYNEFANPMSKNGNVYYAKCNQCNTEYFLSWDTEKNLYHYIDKDSTVKEFEDMFIKEDKKRNIDQYIQP